jgi:hypothetical protein
MFEKKVVKSSWVDIWNNLGKGKGGIQTCKNTKPKS